MMEPSPYPFSQPAPSPNGNGGLADLATGPVALRVVAGPDVGLGVLLMRDPISTGRGRQNQLVLTDRKVSRDHIRFELRDGFWVVQDLDSRNGTRLNGTPVKRGGLAIGDFVYLGDTILRVDAISEP